MKKFSNALTFTWHDLLLTVINRAGTYAYFFNESIYVDF